MISGGILGMVARRIMGLVFCGGTGMVSRGGTRTVSCGGTETVSCGILVVRTALDFVGVGRVALEAFEPIRGVSRGRNDESWALCRYYILWPRRSAVTISAVTPHP